jgi:hypothetical protein
MHDRGLPLEVMFTDSISVRMKQRRPSTVLLHVEPGERPLLLRDLEDRGRARAQALGVRV